MNKTDWGFWAIVTVFALMLLSWIFMPGCAVLQREETPIVIPAPGVQLWQAAKSSNWIVTLSILGIAGGVFATLNGQKWGIAVVVSCSVSLFMSLAVARFAWWMAICGLLGSVSLCVASIMSRKRALVEIIKGVQIFKKNELEPDAIRHLRGELSQQSPSTQKTVKKIKSDLKVKGEI